MKTRQIYHRILLICSLLLGTVGALGADVRNPSVPTPPSGSQVKKETGIFSRLFGRKAERVDGASQNDHDNDDDDDDDEGRRSRARIPPAAPGTTITTTTTTTTRAPVPSQYSGANRNPRAQKDTRSIAPSKSGPISVSREVQPAAPPLARGQDQTRTVVAPTRTIDVPSTVQAPPPPREAPASPPPSTTVAPSDVRNDSLSLQQASQDAPSAVSPSAPVAPQGTATPSPSSSSVAQQNSVAGTPPQDPQSAPSPSAVQPTPPSLPPFATPVPGRSGLVYPPGQKAIPENMIDVSGYAPGTKVRDPDSKVVFRVP